MSGNVSIGGGYLRIYYQSDAVIESGTYVYLNIAFDIVILL